MFFLKELPTLSMLQHYSKMFPQMDIDKTASALKMLRLASELTRNLEQYFSGNGLSLTRFLIMIVLDREPKGDGLSMAQIIENIDISKPVMARTLHNLVSAKYISISPCENDTRQKISTLTGEGKSKLHSVLPGYYAILNKDPFHDLT